MSKLVSISINVDLVDKSKLYKGKKGTYLNISGYLKEEADQYGNFGFVTQDGVKTEANNAPILGNYKTRDFDSFDKFKSKPAPVFDSPSVSLIQDDTLPF